MEQIDELYKSYYNKHLNLNTDGCTIPCMGLISGTRILFIGQNPGHPYSNKDLDTFKDFGTLDYESHQASFKTSWIDSKFMNFIKKVCNSAQIEFNDTSVTNFIKYWTKNNMKPPVTSDDQELLACEIKLLNPDVVVYLSKFAYNNFELKNKIKTKQLVFNHPASKYYSTNYANDIAKTIAKQLN
jgi:uracil-DNA glycosylase